MNNNPPTITTSNDQNWTLDGLGNFSQFNDNGSTQTRGANAPNEITLRKKGQNYFFLESPAGISHDGGCGELVSLGVESILPNSLLSDLPSHIEIQSPVSLSPCSLTPEP